jgi:hypothetical protein
MTRCYTTVQLAAVCHGNKLIMRLRYLGIPIGGTRSEHAGSFKQLMPGTVIVLVESASRSGVAVCSDT